MADVTGWTVGVFRQLQHWVAPDARAMNHEFGVTYYAVCGSPCLHVPELRRIWGCWPHCAICAERVWDTATWDAAHCRPMSPTFAVHDPNSHCATHCSSRTSPTLAVGTPCGLAWNASPW